MPFPQLVICFRTQNVQHPAICFCGDLVRWRSRIVNVLGSLSCQSVPVSGVWIHTVAANTITLHLALDPEIKPLTFLCFSTFAPPIYMAPTASCAVSKRNKEGLTADITKMNEPRNHAHDHAQMQLVAKICKASEGAVHRWLFL